MQETMTKPRVARPVSVRVALSRADALVAALLIGVMLLGGFFRFQANNWDDLVHFHPDERFFTAFVASNMGRGFLSFTDMDEVEKAAERAYCVERNPNTNGVGGYFDARCSDMNPHNIGNGHYAYGTLPPFVAHWTAGLLNQINDTTVYKNHSEITLLWRGLSAFYDTVTILTVFLIGLTMHGKWAGVVAAALYACAVLPIQIAHFATADAMTTMWVAVTLLFVARFHAGGGWLNYALAGAAFGAALASRFNVIPLVVPIIFAAVLRMLPLLDTRLPWGERQRVFNVNFGGLVLAGGMTLLIFRLTNPYAFQGPGFFGIVPNMRWLDDLMQARFETSMDYDGPPHWQWVGRPRYLFAWWNMVMWGMGLALGLAGWLAFVAAGWRMLRGRAGALVNAPLFVWILVYFGWVGGNFVMSMRYYLVLYPALAVLAAWGLVALASRARMPISPLRRALAAVPLVAVLLLTGLWAGMFTNIYRNQATFVQASHWIWENTPGDFAMQLDGTTTAEVPLVNIAFANRNAGNYTLSKATVIEPGIPQRFIFTAPADGTVSSIHAPRLGAVTPGEVTPTTLRLTVEAVATGDLLAEATLTDIFAYHMDRAGRSYDIPLASPLTLRAGQNYVFTAEVQRGAPVASAGTIYANDGVWDEPMPPDVCALPFGVTQRDNPPPGLSDPRNCERRAPLRDQITGLHLDIYRNDTEDKRQDMVRMLDAADYIIIGTNRRYDSNSRIPGRWPLTVQYYESLFSGELGFELVETFHETFELGPLRVSDQYLPTYEALGIPRWLNEWEAEEAFHVYDHPAVFIFKKRDDFSLERLNEILYSVPLEPAGMFTRYNDTRIAGPFFWDTKRATAAPTHLKFSPDMLAVQTAGGTWSERFDRDSLLNTSQPVGVVVWWLTMTLFGLAVWPLLFTAMPGMADRGYGFAKFIGIFLVSWLCWVPATALRLPVWSPEGVRGMTLALAVVSALVAYRQRAKLTRYIREHGRLLLTVEALWAALFGVMLLVRLTNPDLWTTGFGGEKPMNFAYFNGVLRSTIFPPVDPWYAGGFINYYYYGYVIVGVPTLFTQTLPSFAYNLILPTIYASAGIGAFALAFSVVKRAQARANGSGLHLNGGNGHRLANPYLAGIAALLLAVVMGNLDTPRVFFTGVQELGRAGAPELPRTIEEFIYREAANQPADDQQDVYQRAQNPTLADHVRYELTYKSMQLGYLAAGFSALAQGATPPIGSDRWFWGPSRVIGEGNTFGNYTDYSITEFPYFTFVYGDLHPHMIAMPLMLFAMAFVFNELIMAGREQRGLWARALALALGGIVVGMFQAVNTWEWPTFTLFGVLGLGYAWWLNWRRISRRSLLALLLFVGGFLVINFVAKMPYAQWYAASYSAVMPWEGRKTALWMYLQIHGLFLFLLVSLLLWETARWLRAARVRVLRGRLFWLLLGLVGLIGLVAASLLAAVRDYQVALIVLPLVAWIALLFFRPGQSIPMQFVLVLAGLALSITLGVEVVVLSGDIGRQNTIFKFYIQVWLLLSVMGGAAFAWLMGSSDNWRGWQRGLWYVPLSLLVFAAALYPVTATAGKSVYRMASDIPPTLDGADFMEYARAYSQPSFNFGTWLPVDMQADAAIIRWMQDNVQGSPAIIEGLTERILYEWNGRVAIHTGLPSVVGWDHHQRQQRTFDPLPTLVDQRIANVNAFYTTEDLDAAWRILRHFNVQYVIVGGLERARYADTRGLAKFETMLARGWLEVAYETPFQSVEAFAFDGVPTMARVYRVIPDAHPGMFMVMDGHELRFD